MEDYIVVIGTDNVNWVDDPTRLENTIHYLMNAIQRRSKIDVMTLNEMLMILGAPRSRDGYDLGWRKGNDGMDYEVDIVNDVWVEGEPKIILLTIKNLEENAFKKYMDGIRQ